MKNIMIYKLQKSQASAGKINEASSSYDFYKEN
jgi:hypothetical protein